MPALLTLPIMAGRPHPGFTQIIVIVENALTTSGGCYITLPRPGCLHLQSSHRPLVAQQVKLPVRYPLLDKVRYRIASAVLVGTVPPVVVTPLHPLGQSSR
jgi:hypothetical protein